MVNKDTNRKGKKKENIGIKLENKVENNYIEKSISIDKISNQHGWNESLDCTCDDSNCINSM